MTRDMIMETYFYGMNRELTPITMTLHVGGRIQLFRISGMVLPQSCVPLGSATTDLRTKPTPVTAVSRDLLNTILAVSSAEAPDKLVESPLYGFLHVVEVNPASKEMTCLAPCGGQLPGTLLLCSNVLWTDNRK
jgi:hypothetical protein